MRTMLLILIAALTAGFCESTAANAPATANVSITAHGLTAQSGKRSNATITTCRPRAPSNTSRCKSCTSRAHRKTTPSSMIAKRDWVLRIPMPAPEAQTPEALSVPRIWEVKTSTGWQPDAAVRPAPIDTGEPLLYPTVPDPPLRLSWGTALSKACVLLGRVGNPSID